MSRTPSPQLALFASDEEPGLPHPHDPRGRARSLQTAPANRWASLLRLCVLGSGSGGNSTLIAFGQDAILVDAGFGPFTTARRLRQCGVTLEQVRAVCLTHLDQDHFRKSWPTHLLRHGIRLFVHHWHLAGLARLPGSAALFDAGLVETFDEESFSPLPGLHASVVRLQHDLQGTVGYRFDACHESEAVATRHCGSIGYATDLGHVPAALIERLCGVDLLCLESNYDEHMTITSSRPTFVNRRNLSDSGHLSNEQAFDAVRRICERCPVGGPRHVLLMHRSQQCNHPTKVRRVFERDPLLARRIVLTEQRRRSRWFGIRPAAAVRRSQGVLRFAR